MNILCNSFSRSRRPSHQLNLGTYELQPFSVSSFIYFPHKLRTYLYALSCGSCRDLHDLRGNKVRVLSFDKSHSNYLMGIIIENEKDISSCQRNSSSFI